MIWSSFTREYAEIIVFLSETEFATTDFLNSQVLYTNQEKHQDRSEKASRDMTKAKTQRKVLIVHDTNKLQLTQE